MSSSRTGTAGPLLPPPQQTAHLSLWLLPLCASHKKLPCHGLAQTPTCKHRLTLEPTCMCIDTRAHSH